MTTETAANATVSFSTREESVLLSLRDRYQKDQDLFSDRERAQLGFLRWLVESGRVSK